MIDININYNGESKEYPQYSAYSKGSQAAKAQLDSLLNSTTPLDIGFDNK